MQALTRRRRVGDDNGAAGLVIVCTHAHRGGEARGPWRAYSQRPSVVRCEGAQGGWSCMYRVWDANCEWE